MYEFLRVCVCVSRGGQPIGSNQLPSSLRSIDIQLPLPLRLPLGAATQIEI